jgi:hypothetical protein
LEREVTTEEGEQFAQKHGLLFEECSSKENVGVDRIFEVVINKVLDHPTLAKETRVGGAQEEKGVKLEAESPAPIDGDCYC